MEIAVLVFYFLPTIIAIARGAQSALPIALLNIIGGWTLVGWLAAMVWAVMGAPRVPAASDDTGGDANDAGASPVDPKRSYYPPWPDGTA